MSFFDSLAVQADGAVAVATLINAGITTIGENGKTKFTAIPSDPYVTNLCFGEKAMRRAFITLSGTGKLAAMAWPKAGLRLAHYA